MYVVIVRVAIQSVNVRLVSHVEFGVRVFRLD